LSLGGVERERRRRDNILKFHGVRVNDESEDEDAAALFRAAMRNVRRLDSTTRVRPAAKAPAPRARFTRAARAEAALGTLPGTPADFDVGGADPLSFRRPGVPDSALRRLRRGQLAPEAQIDLHGLNAAQAEAELRRFLGSALGRGMRCVRVVHGKGHRSGERGPVLKASVNALLRRSAAVLAFVSAAPEHGGTGATCVLLAAPGGHGPHRP
jgi:DNA-nicking Smr family endonuclease